MCRGETSVTIYTRLAGILLIVTIGAGWFGEVYVPSMMIGGNAAATAAHLKLHDGLFRLGFAAYLVEAFCDVLLAWLFFVLLEPVHRTLSLLAAFLGLISMSLFAVTEMFYFSAPIFLRQSNYLAAFTPAQLEAFAALFLSLYVTLSGLFASFYGAAWIIRGWLTFRSGYLPLSLGVLMIVAGLGFVAKSITEVLAPSHSSDLLLAPMFLNVLATAIWLLTKGVNRDRWIQTLNNGCVLPTRTVRSQDLPPGE